MIYGSEGLLAEYDDTQQPQVEYIRLGGKVIAQRGKATANGCIRWLFCDSFEDSSGMLSGATSGNVTYLHNDILGTPVAATDKSGNIKWRSYRMAFGMVENPSAEPTRSEFPIGYTGHKFDAETGLTYAQARYYRRDSGAFISPDTLTFRESDLTSVNRYSYGANNPYKYIDPTGMGAIADGIGNTYAVEDPRKIESAIKGAKYYAAGAAVVGTAYLTRNPAAALLVGKEIVGEVASEATGGVSDILSTRKMVQRGVLKAFGKSIDDLKNAANMPINKEGLTKAARALNKHASGQRDTGTFPKLIGTIDDHNKVARQIVDEILHNPNSTFEKLPRGDLDVRTPNGQGLRFNADGSFKTFLDPKKN